MRARRFLKAAGFLACLITLAYGGSLRNEFVHDDVLFMTLDPRVRSIDQLPRLLVESRWGFRNRNGGRSVDQYYRPMEPLPYAVSYILFDGAAWPAHLLNLLVHWGNCLLVLAALRRFLADERAAMLAAVVFAIHPGYSEAILWPAAFGGLGAFTCCLALLLLHTGAYAHRWPVRPLMALLFLCGLWCKETAGLAPLLLALYDLLLAPDHGWRRAWRQRWSYVALLPPLALYVGLRVHALGSLVPGLHYVPLTPGELLLNAIALLPQYARTFLWPFDLNLYHDFDAIHGAAHWSFGLGVALLLVALIVLVATVRSQPALAFGVAWALTTLSPYLFVHVPAGNVFAERYLYDPAFGVCMVLGSGWMWLRPQLKAAHVRFAAAVGAATMMMLFLALDVRRTLQWRDQVTLYTKTLSQSARAEVIRINLAVRYLELHRYDDGIAVLKELLAFAPAYRGAWYNLGLLYQAKHMTDEAIAAYEEARRTDPFDASALLNLGYLYDQRGRREEAVAAYLRLVEMEPRNAQGWYNLAVVAYEHGQLANARTAVRRVLAQSPDDAQALQREIQRRPKPATTDEDQGQTLHRCSVAKRLFDGGHFEDAISTLKAAAWLDETSALPHHYLANMYYAKGRLLVAIRHQREALRLAPQNELYRRNLTALQRALAARMPRPLE